MIKVFAFGLAITAVNPPPEPPPVTLTFDQMMTIRAAIESLQEENDDLKSNLVYWYKKAGECKKGTRI